MTDQERIQQAQEIVRWKLTCADESLSPKAAQWHREQAEAVQWLIAQAVAQAEAAQRARDLADAASALWAAIDEHEATLQRVTDLCEELADGRGWIIDKLNTALGYDDASGKDGPQ